MNDPHDLRRFVDAQAHSIDPARDELRAGRKRSHWMWFVFPQLRGLGASAMAIRYAIASRDEAVAYLRHSLLGPRLVECTALVVQVEERTLHDIFGSPDDAKFRSSMTLFAATASDPSRFDAALVKFCDGLRDEKTLALLADLS